MRNYVIVAYDVADPIRLRQVSRIVRDFGNRIQLSVFICQVSLKDIAVMKERLLDIIKSTEDKIMLIRLKSTEIKNDEIPSEIEMLGCKTEISNLKNFIF